MSKDKYGVFEGWYMKHQIEDRVFSFIVSFHLDESGEGYGCVQFITTEGSFFHLYELDKCVSRMDKFDVRMENSRFSTEGIKARIDFGDIKVVCDVKYEEITPCESHIMGPFRYMKKLECSHEILSLTHKLCGYIELDGIRMDVSQGVGYIEKDSGKSFPCEYVWTQCNFRYMGDNAIMMATAKVPIGGKTFMGVICEIYYGGLHYRMATYRGCVVELRTEHCVIIRQGRRKLYVQKIDEREDAEKKHRLLAPSNGKMSKEIEESPSCKVRYTFYDNGKKRFDFVSHQASYEYV